MKLLLTVLTGTLSAAPALAATAPQMEKRDRELFERQAFERAAPKLGRSSPDLCLETLEGRPWSLAQELGKTVVLVKASFT